MNQLGDLNQFSEALLFANKLLREGILTGGHRREERVEPLFVPSICVHEEEPLRVPSSSCIVGAGFGTGNATTGNDASDNGGVGNAAAVARRHPFQEVSPPSVEQTPGVLYAPNAGSTNTAALNDHMPKIKGKSTTATIKTKTTTTLRQAASAPASTEDKQELGGIIDGIAATTASVYERPSSSSKDATKVDAYDTGTRGAYYAVRVRDNDGFKTKKVPGTIAASYYDNLSRRRNGDHRNDEGSNTCATTTVQELREVGNIEEHINMNMNNAANLGKSGEGTKAEAAVAAVEKGGDGHLGFKWSIIARRTHQSWDDRMEQLREYKKEHGHFNVPKSCESLGAFVRNQRARYKLLLEGKPAGRMTQERANQLEALGFKWSITPQSWDDRMEQLREYKKEYGHLNVPKSCGSLGIFVRNQRARYKLLIERKPTNGMNQERANQLEAIGFKWSSIARPTHQSWGDRMEQLRDYKKEHGHLCVPQSHGSLGIFIRNQRTRYKLLLEGKPAKGMTRERAKQLEALGFKWSAACTQN